MVSMKSSQCLFKKGALRSRPAGSVGKNKLSRETILLNELNHSLDDHRLPIIWHIIRPRKVDEFLALVH